MPRMPRLVLPALLLAAAACGGGAGSTDTAAAAAPAVDLAREEQAIRALDAKLLEALQRRDTVALADFYAESGLLLVPGSPPLRGPNGVRLGWQRIAGAQGTAYFTPTIVNVAAGGDMAYEVGSYTVTGGRNAGKGKYVAVWRKYDGAWKIVADARSADGAGQ